MTNNYILDGVLVKNESHGLFAGDILKRAGKTGRLVCSSSNHEYDEMDVVYQKHTDEGQSPRKFHTKEATQ